MKDKYLLRKILHAFNLEPELDDYDQIRDTIAKGSIFKGTNLWILVFAIIIASVGLNMNSPGVIIGAMLISPLMGPINGIGFSLATYDFGLFRQALRNFLFAVAASLSASTIYFALSPVSTAHSELLARTTPTIYDVLIALFGGLAGIVAISSRQKGNVIPGVAIATALMPPLCTAGYGLATAQFDFFFGAFYLFTINTVFIALASVLISRALNFPLSTPLDDSGKKRINRWISVVILLVMLPSIYFGYLMVRNERFSRNADLFLADVSAVEGNYLLKSEVNPDRSAITLVYGGMPLSENQKERIISRAANFGLSKEGITIRQGLDIGESGKHNAETLRLREEIDRLNRVLKSTEQRTDSLRGRSIIGRELLAEIRSFYPQITTCSFSVTLEYMAGNPFPDTVALVVLKAGSKKITPADRGRIDGWLKARLETGTIRTFYP
ncbi:MAG TPA: DUF389 domain-containing protein [Bacteroidales bacterium]|nr:DUF389 domain-containing protein [Bacteroidales bacterium]HPS61750.1 DUF389 domain-containing protein [Bacteroidales bacterium]